MGTILIIKINDSNHELIADKMNGIVKIMRIIKNPGYPIKKILVTGGAGYIGSHTVEALIAAGLEVVIIDDLSTGFKELIHPQAKFYNTSILDTQKVLEIVRLERIEGIIHFAAKIIVPESLEQPLAYYKNNTQGVISLMEVAKLAGITRFVFSSTAAVYGDVQIDYVSEDYIPNPVNPYGQSKLMSERIIIDCEKDFGLKSVILRYFNVAGASSNLRYGQLSPKATQLIKVAAQAAAGTKPYLEITGTDYPTKDGTGVRDYIHVEDLADIHLLALQYLSETYKSEIINCGYGKGFSVRDVINSMKKISGKDFPVHEVARRSGDTACVLSDNSKLLRLFKWKPKHENIDSICKSAYDWEKNIFSKN